MNLLIFNVFLLACAGEEESPGEHICEQVGVRGAEVTAGVDEASAPEVDASEAPTTVLLVANEAGFVLLHGEGEALLALGDAGVATGLFVDGGADSLPESAPLADCPDEVPAHFDLTLGGEVVLQLGPTALDEVWLMLYAGGHDHDHE